MRKDAVTMRIAVVHHSGVPELAHAGIHERDAGAPLLPRPQLRRVQARPRERVELRPQVLRREVGVVVERRARRTRASRARRGTGRPLPGLDRLVPHRVRAELAPSQPRRQPARSRPPTARPASGRSRRGRRRGTRAAEPAPPARPAPTSRAGPRPSPGRSAAAPSRRGRRCAGAERGPGISRGSGSGARGAGIDWHARQNGVKTEYGVPGSGLHGPRLEQQRGARTTRPSARLRAATPSARHPPRARRRRSGGSRRRRRPRHPRHLGDDGCRRPAPQHQGRRRARAGARRASARLPCSHHFAAPPSGRMPSDSSSST